MNNRTTEERIIDIARSNEGTVTFKQLRTRWKGSPQWRKVEPALNFLVNSEQMNMEVTPQGGRVYTIVDFKDNTALARIEMLERQVDTLSNKINMLEPIG